MRERGREKKRTLREWPRKKDVKVRREGGEVVDVGGTRKVTDISILSVFYSRFDLVLLFTTHAGWVER